MEILFEISNVLENKFLTLAVAKGF
jgi:hypothetical protein